MSRLPDPKPSKRGLPFLARTRAMSSGGASGFEAYTIGFTLVGCIAAGAGAGYLLDQHFGTGYWLPILFLVGVGAGFREMMVVLKRINEQQAQDKRARESARATATVRPTDNPTPTQIAARKRMFEVPPPPFEEAAQTVAQNAAPNANGAAPGEVGVKNVGVENVLQQMLAQGDLSAEDLQELGFDVELPGAASPGAELPEPNEPK